MGVLDDVRKRVQANQRIVARLDRALARRIQSVYNSARRDLMVDLVDAFNRLGDDPTPAQVRALAVQGGLIEAIERRIFELDQDFRLALDEELRGVVDVTHTSLIDEVKMLADALGVPWFPMAIDPLLELAIEPAIEQIPALTLALRVELQGTLRGLLAQGERMEEITRQLYGRGADSGIFQRKLTSARRMAHRAVSEAENTARTAFLQDAKENSLPTLQRQAIARIGGKTSDTCLGVHGDIVDIGEPFSLSGKSRLGSSAMVPPFHWGPCRTSTAGYLPQFEETSTVKTADLKASAAAEWASRD